MKKVIAILAITALVLTGLILYTIQTQKPVVGTSTQVLNQFSKATPEEVLKLVNAERAKVNAPALVVSEALTQTAQERADDMVARNYYSHFDPVTGEGMIDKQDPGCKQSENLNGVTNSHVSISSATRVVSTWMNSEPHRKAMLNPEFTITGIAIEKDIIVQHFCK